MAQKTWCFTLNHYTPHECEMVNLWVDNGTVTRLTVTKEVGESGTPHLQGAVTFKEAKRLAACKSLLDRAHWEVAKAKQGAFDYCLKSTSQVLVCFRKTNQGKRNDIHDAMVAIESGATLRQLWTDHAAYMNRYHRNVPTIMRALAPIQPASFSHEQFSIPPIDWDLLHHGRGRSVILVGPANIGKTEYAKAQFRSPLFVCDLDTLTQFDPGEHDGIIFDDMSFSHLPRSTQIYLLDVDNDRDIHVRYQTARIPRGTKKIFVTNIEGIFDLNDSAINTRVEITRCDEFLIKK